MRVLPGKPHPLGATFDGHGVNFAVRSAVAHAVALCLFDEDGQESTIGLTATSGDVWHGYVPGLRPGQEYGFRVRGPFNPKAGHRCNPHKLLLDPYARAVAGQPRWHPSVYGYPQGDDGNHADLQDSAAYVPRSVVVNPFFDWDNVYAPRTQMIDSVIYEVHVRGFTKLHPEVPEELRGTYSALAHPAVLDHLRRLGVTAVQLQPVHQFFHSEWLTGRSLKNFWGYDSIGFFAPHNEYAAGGRPEDVVHEFKRMVRALHRAGIEVILDVVYNHTAEGNHLGPTLCFRGLDNAAYYRLVPEQPHYYLNYSGTGNTTNTTNPAFLQLVMDSLRYWVTEMRVDGFRFDLAAALGREKDGFDATGRFFSTVGQDPVLRTVKLIAEPWDVGPFGYQLGQFPHPWRELNGKFRDDVRDYWRGEDGTLPNLARRLAGSEDLFRQNRRPPNASVNFVTSHDGFTLSDLVSYNHKHNHANGEGNRDGDDHNRSWNCGAEGPTDDAVVLMLRERQQRNFIVTTFLAQGVPFLLAGDELGRTQRGNNNAYCQDNEISWVDWKRVDRELHEFVRFVSGLRRQHPIFRRSRWPEADRAPDDSPADIEWFRPDGHPMNQDDWHVPFAKALAVYWYSGRGARLNRAGLWMQDRSFLLLLNAGPDIIDFHLPHLGENWTQVIDTGAHQPTQERSCRRRRRLPVAGRTLKLLRGDP